MAKIKGKNAWEDLVRPRLDEIAEWVADGVALKVIAKQLGISTTTLWKLSKEQQDLKKALTYEEVATENVENSLYKKCIGFDHVFFVDVKLKETWYDENGKMHTKEKLEKQQKCVYIEPDVNAQKFWLLNHASDRYKSEQPEINVTNELLEKSDDILVKIRTLAQETAPVEENDKKE